MKFSNDKQWNALLRENNVKMSEKSFIADVQSYKTYTNEDIARLIKSRGFEISLETLICLFKLKDRIIREILVDGNKVKTDNFILTPSIIGSFCDTNDSFDKSLHKKSVKICNTSLLENVLSDINVKIISKKKKFSFILGIYSLEYPENKLDTLYQDSIVLIKGKNIKLQDNDKSKAYIEFVGENKSYIFDSDSSSILLNKQNMIELKDIRLEKDEYKVNIYTCYSGKETALKNIKKLEYTGIVKMLFDKNDSIKNDYDNIINLDKNKEIEQNAS